MRRTGEKYRAWLFGLFTELAAATGYAEPEGLARRLHLLYDGAEQAARMDGAPSTATTARAVSAPTARAPSTLRSRPWPPVSWRAQRAGPRTTCAHIQASGARSIRSLSPGE
ncbi:hypothetical protein G6W51_19935 [Streptomyces coelicolor]|nr:hypothetical protein [Streptomyces coelicolor]